MRNLLDWVERRSGAVKLVCAWLVSFSPRVCAAMVLGLSKDYYFFISGERSSYWHLLYSKLAYAIWHISSGNLVVYAGLHILIHSLVGPVVYAICKNLKLSPRVTWLAVLGTAFLPYYVSLGSQQPQTGVTIVAFAIMLLCFLFWYNHDLSLWYSIPFSLVSTIIIPLRPNAISTTVLLFAFAMTTILFNPAAKNRRFVSAFVKKLLPSFLVLVLLLASLSLFNLKAFGDLSIFKRENFGYTWYAGNNSYVKEYLGRYDISSLEDTIKDHGLPEEAMRELDPRKQDLVLSRFALAFIKEHPGEASINTFYKMLRYWDVRLENAKRKPLLWNLLYSGPYVVYGLLAIFGTALLVRRRFWFQVSFVWVCLISYWLPIIPMLPAIRFRMTTEFLLVILAAFALECVPIAGKPSTDDS